MTEKNAAGLKEFFFAVLWAAAIAAVYDAADTFIKLYGNNSFGSNIILTAGAVGCFCVLVFFVIKYYASSYTYELNNETIKLERKIGHRVRTVEIKRGDIIAFSKNRPQNAKKIIKLKKAVFSHRKSYYITYKNGREILTAEFEPSDKMASEIFRTVKEG